MTNHCGSCSVSACVPARLTPDLLKCARLRSSAYSGVGTWSGDGADGNQALRLAPLTRKEVLAAYEVMQGAVRAALIIVLCIVAACTLRRLIRSKLQNRRKLSSLTTAHTDITKVSLNVCALTPGQQHVRKRRRAPSLMPFLEWVVRHLRHGSPSEDQNQGRYAFAVAEVSSSIPFT